ncbi:cobalamin ABC transporter substrate-binding protein, partial [Citromicrobium bathyomarinum]
VIVDPPQLLLHAGAQGDEQSRTLHHPVLRDLPTRRAEFSPQLYYCGGPSLLRAAKRLAAIRDGAA